MPLPKLDVIMLPRGRHDQLRPALDPALQATPSTANMAATMGTTIKQMAFAFLPLMLLTACNPELDRYNRAHIGQPCPDLAAFPTTAPAAFGQTPHGKSDTFFWHLPSIYAVKCSGVLLDPTGKVTAKYYCAFSSQHWLIAQGGGMDWRLEVEVPEEFFHEAPKDWKDVAPSFDAQLTMSLSARELSAGLPENLRGIESEIGTAFAEYRAVHLVPMNPERIGSNLLSQIPQSGKLAVDLHRDLDLTGAEKAFEGIPATYSLVRKGQQILLRVEVREPRTARHVPGYLNAVQELLDKATATKDMPAPPRVMLATNFALGMFVAGSSQWPNMLQHHHEDLSGITTSGFERTIDFGNGSKATIRNCGDRRLQLLFKFNRVIDPFFIIPTIQFAAGTPQPVVVTRTKQ